VLSKSVPNMKPWIFLSVDFEQCGKHIHTFWQDPYVNLLIISGCPDRSRIRFVISHNSCGYDAQFILRRFLEMSWASQLIMDGSKFLSMVVDNLHFMDSLNYLPMSLKSMPKSFDFTCKMGHYLHFFNTANNLDYVGSYP